MSCISGKDYTNFHNFYHGTEGKHLDTEICLKVFIYLPVVKT